MAKTSNIEDQLRQAILDAPMSCSQLSKLSGVSRGVISHFVNRNRSVTMETAAKLARVLGLELKPTNRAKKGR